MTTGTTTIPSDNTIPQNTEGDQYITLAITPKSASNTLIIEGFLNLATSGAVDVMVALFQDSTTNALATIKHRPAATSDVDVFPISFSMVAGTTSSTTFKLRAGGASSTTLTINGEAGAGKFGGTLISYLRITEYAT